MYLRPVKTQCLVVRFRQVFHRYQSYLTDSNVQLRVRTTAKMSTVKEISTHLKQVVSGYGYITNSAFSTYFSKKPWNYQMSYINEDIIYIYKMALFWFTIQGILTKDIMLVCHNFFSIETRLISQWSVILFHSFIYFLAMSCSMWDLSSPTRDREFNLWPLH